ncbi:MAG: hypothetical protein ACOWWO_05055 [Peptococcaceae bacterium]
MEIAVVSRWIDGFCRLKKAGLRTAATDKLFLEMFAAVKELPLADNKMLQILDMHIVKTNDEIRGEKIRLLEVNGSLIRNGILAGTTAGHGLTADLEASSRIVQEHLNDLREDLAALLELRAIISEKFAEEEPDYFYKYFIH